MPSAVHINLDDAWEPERLDCATVDARAWGPALRYMAPHDLIRRAVSEWPLNEAQLILCGSGDFHHLAGWWLQACLARHSGRRVALVSFDNHPDWDIRPPRWACGGWINRALEHPQVERAIVWGCGNFELAFPSRLFRNRRALATQRLCVHGWAERQSAATARRFDCMTRQTWRERFTMSAAGLAGRHLYVTVDLDALAAAFAQTNWENGLFTPDDLVWALHTLRRQAPIAGIDCCGAFSPPRYARRWQRLAANFDHPRETHDPAEARRLNHKTLSQLWPSMCEVCA